MYFVLYKNQISDKYLVSNKYLKFRLAETQGSGHWQQLQPFTVHNTPLGSSEL